MQELVQRAQAGDLSAFDGLVARYQDAVCGAAFGILGSFDDAEDIAQEVFVQAWRDLHSLRDPAKFPGWLHRITGNRCRDLLRRPQREREPLDPAAPLPAGPDSDPADHAARADLRRRVLAAISTLSEPNRMATTLFYIDGYSVAEVAGFLETPVGTIKRRLHDSRRRLKTEMMAMMRESLEAGKPGPELRARVAAELHARRDAFDAMARGAADQDNTEWARWWHERRMADVRANAAQYGIAPDEELPRMLPEYRQRETFRDDMKDMPRRWGIPEGLDLVSLRDLCRELIVSPLSLYRWRDDGLPIVRYYPWVLFDRERVGQWLAGARPDSVQQVSADDLRRPLLTVLQAVAEGVATAEDGADLYGWLETAHFLGPRDPVWTPLWSASVEQERRDNAAQYGLTEPTDSWLGIPPDEARGNVFEIRDLSRRVGASPIDVVRWTHEGMACLRSSPLVRWDIRRVTEWLSEGGFLPDRRTIKELDVTERFVFEAVAAGDATPSEAHEALSGWIGVM